jgi:hypothetical protein
LKPAALGTSVQDLCRTHSVSAHSVYEWNKIYGAMEPSEARELKELERGLLSAFMLAPGIID